MHVRVRIPGKTDDTIVVIKSKLTKIEEFRTLIETKFGVKPNLQRIFYGGKILEDGYTFHDYNVKINDVIQIIIKQHVSPLKINNNDDEEEEKKEKNEIVYIDAKSSYYSVGDLIDTRDKSGSWYESKIIRIVYNPDISLEEDTSLKKTQGTSSDEDIENKPPKDENTKENAGKAKSSQERKESNDIKKYFEKLELLAKKRKMKPDASDVEEKFTDNLLYQVIWDLGDEHESEEYFCKLQDIRPRARREIEPKELKVGQTVMLNINLESRNEKGLWYDFTITEIQKLRFRYEVTGTVYIGSEGIPQHDTKVKIHDKVYAIEKVVPVAKRSKEYQKMMVTKTEIRTQPLNCLVCRDDKLVPCKSCGCLICHGKREPDKIILCDDCNQGYHMDCLTPVLEEIPKDEWFCPSCKRDPMAIVAPGAKKQEKKTASITTKRDWGRGMACAGTSKTCSMPSNHFGPIPGIEVGMCWRFRIQVSETGIHRPPVSGIHGRDSEGAYSIVLSGGYEDDYDNGNEFTYTGSGGRDLSGNKRTAQQSCDQTLTRENRALARNCAVDYIDENGGDAGDRWREGKPVRVVRSCKMKKHFPKYAPEEGIRYDGIYKVVKYYPETGLAGFRVWKYLLRRDDPSPSPWTPGAKQFSIIYPDGYLEAEAQKKSLVKDGKTKPRKRFAIDSDDEELPPAKKRNTGRKSQKNDDLIVVKIPSMFKKVKPKTSTNEKQPAITPEEIKRIEADTLNEKLWKECLIVSDTRNRKEFVEYVTEIFKCIICQDVASNPVTTSCLHNYCMVCLKLAFSSTGSQSCPACRQNLILKDLKHNEELKTALQTIMPGYDLGKK